MLRVRLQRAWPIGSKNTKIKSTWKNGLRVTNVIHIYELQNKNEYFSYQVSKPKDCLIDIEWIVHVSIDKSRGVDESDECELLGLGCRDLGVDVVYQPIKLGQGLEMRVQVERSVSGQGLSLSATVTNTFQFLYLLNIVEKQKMMLHFTW